MCSSLVDLCLGVIVNKIDRYNLAFMVSEDAYLKRNLEGLQRKFSFEIISRLLYTERNHYLDEYADFLINKYLKTLNTSWLSLWSREKITSLIAEFGCNIETICFHDRYPWEDMICYLPNLKRFTYEKHCHDLIIENVAKFCPNIEEINVRQSNVTNVSMEGLCANKSGKLLSANLKKILISGSDVTEGCVKYLVQSLPLLEMIDYINLPQLLYSLHKNDLSSVDKMYNINTLNFMYCIDSPYYENILKVSLSVCPYLKSLSCGLAKEEEFDVFDNLRKLEFLNIRGVLGTKINMNSFLTSKGGKLTSLTLGNCKVSLCVIAKSCPLLKELNLEMMHLIDDHSTLVFNSLTSLSFITVSVSFNKTAIGLLLSSTNKLESLLFQNCCLRSSGIKAHILKCCELNPIKRISFCFSAIDIQFIKVLLRCRSFSYVDTYACFGYKEEYELVKLAERLWDNKTEIITSKLNFNEYKEFMDENYECDDSEEESSSDYDDSDERNDT